MNDMTADTFRAHLREQFRLDAGTADALTLELATVSGGGDGADGRPFSVVFLGPGDPVLPQRIYRLEHIDLGVMELFLVPIGREADGVRYEAVFG